MRIELVFIRLANESRAHILYECWRLYAPIFEANSHGRLKIARVVSSTIQIKYKCGRFGGLWSFG